MDDAKVVAEALNMRFGEAVQVPEEQLNLQGLAAIARRGVCRRYAERPVTLELLRLLCACALAAPSKSDLQQRDIVIVSDPGLRGRIAALLPHMPWVGEAPAFVVVCVNGARLPQLSELRGKPFANDHLDHFFNATGDAAIALGALLQAAEAVGLGGCPISELRNHAAHVSEWLALPDRVLPFAGLCLGWPTEAPAISMRLPLSLTIHENRYGTALLAPQIEAYDQRREALQPYAAQRARERWGEARPYGWSEDKARQYAVPQRADFGAFVRAKGFSLD